MYYNEIMEQLINIITQNGIGVVCVAFMIYFISTTLKQNNETLTEIQKSLVGVQTTLSDLSNRITEVEQKLIKKSSTK